jgi:vitamin B12 transporter
MFYRDRNFFGQRYIGANNTRRAVALAMLAIVSTAAFAEGAPSSEIYQLGEVLVTDKYEGNDIGTSYQLTREDFERTNARSLDDALREIPSINVRNGGDGTPRLDVRGLRTRQIKLLVNGIPFNSAEDGQFDPTLIPTFAIGRIQLQAGASSVLYGDGGMGGVLDIQTRGGFDGFKAGGKAEFGSDHYWNTNAYAGYGDGTNDFFAAAGVRARDAFPMSDNFSSAILPTRENFQDDDRRLNSDYRRVNLLTSYARQLTEKLRIGVFLSRFEGHYGKPPSALDCQGGGNAATCVGAAGDPFASGTKYERVDDQDGTSIQIGADYAFNDAWSGRLWYFANKQELDNTVYDDADFDTFINRGSSRQRDRVKIDGVHAQLTGVFQTGTRLGVSLGRRAEAFDSDGVSCDNARVNRNQTCSFSATLVSTNALNAQVKYSPLDIDKTIHVDSIALEINQPLPFDFGLVAGIGRHVLDKDGGRDDNAGSAQLGLARKLTAASSIYGTVARKVDAPTIRQLYDASSGNDTLGFERANHFEAGVKNRWARLDLDVALYQSRVHDFIERSETTNRFENRQKLLFRGVDVNARWRASDALTFGGAVGLLHARDESSDRDSATLQYRPRHKVALSADYRWMERWRLNAEYQRIGGQAHFNRNDASDYRNLDSFDLVSARISYQLPRNIGAIYVGADNLLDEEYETSYGFPQAGRMLYSGVQLDW